MTKIQAFKYSLSNPYATDYYRAYNQFKKVEEELAKYRRNPNYINNAKYKQFEKDYKYFENNIPDISRRAEAYEKKLMKNKEQNANATNYSPEVAKNIDYFT